LLLTSRAQSSAARPAPAVPPPFFRTIFRVRTRRP